MPFAGALCQLLFLSVLAAVMFVVAGWRFKAEGADDEHGMFSVVVGIVAMLIALAIVAYLVNGNAAYLELNTGQVYCVEWSGEEGGVRQYLIHNEDTNRRYFVEARGDIKELPSGCFIKKDNGGLLTVPTPPAK